MYGPEGRTRLCPSGRERLTVLGDGGTLGQSKVSILKERQVSNGVLGEELGSLVVALHGERLVIVELNTGESGGS